MTVGMGIIPSISHVMARTARATSPSAVEFFAGRCIVDDIIDFIPFSASVLSWFEFEFKPQSVMTNAIYIMIGIVLKAAVTAKMQQTWHVRHGGFLKQKVAIVWMYRHTANFVF